MGQVLHGDGAESERGDNREFDIERGERELPAEGDPRTGEGPDNGHHIRDSGATRRCEGDREEFDRAASDILGHGGSGGGPGPPAERHREPCRACQLLRQKRNRAASGGQRVPEELQKVDLLCSHFGHHSRHHPPLPNLDFGFTSLVEVEALFFCKYRFWFPLPQMPQRTTTKNRGEQRKIRTRDFYLILFISKWRSSEDVLLLVHSCKCFIENLLSIGF